MPGLVEVLNGDLVPVEPADRQETHHERREQQGEARLGRVDLGSTRAEEGGDAREHEHQGIRRERRHDPGPALEDPPTTWGLARARVGEAHAVERVVADYNRGAGGGPSRRRVRVSGERQLLTSGLTR